MARRIIFLLLNLFFLYVFIFSVETNEEKDEIFELKVKELSFTIIPTFKLIVPETSVILGLRQKIGETDFLAQSEYNYIHSKINYLLEYTVNLYLPVFVNLYDNVNFEKIYESKKYLQRNKGYGGGIKTQKIFDFLILKQEIKSENYYFASIDDKLNITQGNIFLLLIHKIFLNYQYQLYNQLQRHFHLLKKKYKKEILRDFYLSINFEKAIPSDFSEYNFLFLNLISDYILYLENKRTINFYMEYGYLLTRDNLPVWKIYNLGGYEKLMGFQYDEYQGYYKFFSRIKGKSIIWDNINFEFLFLKLTSIDGFLVFDAGQVGNIHEIQNFTDYKMSAGAGIDFNILFRNKLKITLTLATGQAIKQGRSPVFYFIYVL